MKIKLSTSFITISALSATLLLSACGSSSSDGSTTSSTTAVAPTSGQLVDNYVENVDYICGDGSTGITDANGFFTCPKLPVSFSLKGLKLGEMQILPSDTQVFPQDMIGVPRDDLNNTDVIAMAQFLQSCDDDKDPKNGIMIKEELKAAFEDTNLTFNAQDLNYYVSETNITLVSEDEATAHLEETVSFVEDVNSADIPKNIKDALLTPNSTLTQETKDTLSYMGNEERLAHDVYLELYNYHLSVGNGEIKQLTNIATKSETTHIETVQALINKYDLNSSSFTNIDMPELGYKETAVDDMVMGTYDIQDIQDLHDALIAKGEQSVQDALEVGCMVEVTDINDLLIDIQTAHDSNATDIETAFEFLRDGSYSHYWSFDSGLKNMGITDGCCSLGEAYCHPEYPTNTKGSDASSDSCDNGQETTTQPENENKQSKSGPQDGTGEQKGKNR